MSANRSPRGSVAIITGSAGLVGAEAARQFTELGLDIFGIDNDSRGDFFGETASTYAERRALERELPRYRHFNIDIRDQAALSKVFAEAGSNVSLVIHAAAQPSHDWSALDPQADFAINASATLTMLELCRRHCPEASFQFMSTNKVYGDNPNRLPLVEEPTRWALPPDHNYSTHGIDEHMSIDRSAHSIFGVSKLAADLMVQEYGQRFGLLTTCFRAGCITGRGHQGTFLHGFMAHLCATAKARRPYQIVGYKGKQVRDILHSSDLVGAFRHVFERPQRGAVYNIGAGPYATCSVIELLALCEEITGRRVERSYQDSARFGDHIWWVTDNRKFQSDYAGWAPSRRIKDMAIEILDRD